MKRQTKEIVSLTHSMFTFGHGCIATLYNGPRPSIEISEYLDVCEPPLGSVPVPIECAKDLGEMLIKWHKEWKRKQWDTLKDI